MDAAARAEIDAAITRMLEKVGRDVAADAARFAPIRSGALKASVKVEPVQDNTVVVRANANYAGYVELGTRYMHAQPYLRPALYRVRDVS